MAKSGVPLAFATLLRAQRLEAGLTQAALAEQANLSVRTVQDLERGLVRPRRDTVRRIVAVLKPSADVVERFDAGWIAPRRRGRAMDATDDRASYGQGRRRSDDDVLSAGCRARSTGLTSFVGRERDLEGIVRKLSTSRLLTLVGVGGVGKTRLALETVSSVQADYQDGARLVELAGVADPCLVSQTLAAALQLIEQPDSPVLHTMIAGLRHRRMLILLDNCEHLADACAALVEPLLLACDDLRVLATSREPLGVAGEVVWRVQPLAVPETGTGPRSLDDLAAFGAVRLFVDRAQAMDPTFSLSEPNAQAVAEICRRLDGIPLALELAASRVRVLTLGQIATRLDDQLGLLTTGARRAVPRQQTLRATLDWSYELLDSSERTLLRRLAVFSGGWMLEAAEAICAGDAIDRIDVLDLLARLVDASLVVVEQRSDEARYRLLEPIRQYALQHLVLTSEEAVLRECHARWCLALAEEASLSWRTADQAGWFTPLELEYDNLRAALTWSLDRGGCAEVGLRLVAALRHFWDLRGSWAEGRQWTEQALRSEVCSSAPSDVGVLLAAGLFAYRHNDWGQATARCTDAHALARRHRDTRHEVLALTYLGLIAQTRAEYDRARRLHQDALVTARVGGDRTDVAIALDGLGRLAEREGSYPQAADLFEEALALHRERGDTVSAAWTLTTLALVARRQGALRRAVALGGESLRLYRDLRDRHGVAFALHNLGRAALLLGDRVQARSRFAESLRIWRDIGSRLAALRSLEGLAAVSVADGEPVRAVRLLAATQALDRRIGRVLSPAEQQVYEQLVATSRADLDAATVMAACMEGRAMSFEQAVSYALSDRCSTG